MGTSFVSLSELHGILQVSMGWESFRLYYLNSHAIRYGSFELSTQSPDIALPGSSFESMTVSPTTTT